MNPTFVDAMLPDGHRLHVVLEGISRGFSAVNIRKVVVRASRLHDLVALDSLSDHAARFLDASVRAGLNIVITGGTQAGKTPFLNCLAASIPGEDRVAVATDAVLKHVVERIAVPGAELIQATVDERLQVSALKKRLGEIEHDEMIVEQGPASLTSKQRQLGQLQEERERTLETLGRLTRRMALGSLLIDRVAVSQERDGRKYLSLEAAVKARRQARERLEALDLDRQREIIRLMLTVRVEPSPQGVRPTKHTARQRVKVTPLDPRTGEELTMQAEPAS